MAGSIKAMLYTADNGDTYAVRIDESNGEACGFSDVTTPTSNGLPRNITMRYVNTFRAAEPVRKRRFWVGTPAAFTTILNNGLVSAPLWDDEADEDWIVSSSRGERVSVYSDIDTGLTDGDVT
jgi:hypothetical protein